MLQIALVKVSNGPQGPELWFLLCLTLIGNCSCCFVFEPREYARAISFENAVDCTSQRVKRTSGARVMIVSCLTLVGNCLTVIALL